MPSHPHHLAVTFSHRGVLTIGALMLLFGGLLSWFVLQHEIRLHCDRQSGECIHETRNAYPFATTIREFPVNAIEGARIVHSTSTSSGSSSTTYRAQLLTATGQFELSAYGSSGRAEHQALVDSVTGFLDSDQPALTLAHRPGWLLTGILGLFPLVGLLMVMGLRTLADARIDTGSGLLVLRRRRWWQSGGQVQRIPLAQISNIRVESTRSGGSGRRTTHRVVIDLSDGSEHPLFGFSSSGQGAFRREAQLRELLLRAGVRLNSQADLSGGQA
ncbi:MAG: hypothetical protein ACP5DC_10970 [Halothiobacillaceae bacterium]